MSDILNIIFAIAPIFIVIIFGYFLRKTGKISKGFWNNSDFLIYWVFMPSLFFTKSSKADLQLGGILDFSIILCLIFLFSLIYSLFSLKYFNISKNNLLPTLQAICRINTVIVLAISNALYGSDGLEIAVIGSAILVPLINIGVPIFLLFIIKDNQINIIEKIKNDIIFSPIILSMFIGLIFNYYNIKDLPILHSSLSIVANAALPIMLLSLGASLKIKEIKGRFSPIMISMTGKLILTPIITIILCLFINLPANLFQIAIIYGSVPTGVIVYTMVKRAKGDSKLASAMVTTHILISFITMPIFIIFTNLFL